MLIFIHVKTLRSEAMRLFFFFVLLFTTLYAQKAPELNQRFESSKSCIPCHMHIREDWKNSWHAKSHTTLNEYFRKSVEFVAKKEYKSINSVKIECAKCHNPRISVTSTDANYEMLSAMHIETSNSKIDKAVESDTLTEGINCLVCHNVDKIHDKKDKSVRGMDRVSWTAVGTIAGPFADAKSPYHKTTYRDHFTDKSDRLCMVCHANDTSRYGLAFTNLESEYKSKGKSCKDCHMGKPEKLYASSYLVEGDKQKERMIRRHTFQGAHSYELWRDALGLKLSKKKKGLEIAIHNANPHNIPTGFGGREIEVEAEFFQAGKKVDVKRIALTTHYQNRKGRATIPHLAIKQSKDMSIKANSTKKITIDLPQEIDRVKVTLYYKLVNDEIQELLDLQEEVFLKKFIITSKGLRI